MFNRFPALQVAWFLATTRIKRSGFLSTGLIILVMTLTFLNLLVVRGILIGLPEGAVQANEEKYYGDVYISPLESKKHISDSARILSVLAEDHRVRDVAVRYRTRGSVTADFKKRLRSNDLRDEVNARMLGVRVADEDAVVSLSESLHSGRMFRPDSRNEVVVGVDLLSSTGFGDVAGLDTLDNVEIGSELEITVGKVTKRVEVVGLYDAKVNEIDTSVLMSHDLFRDFVTREDFEPDEIIVGVSAQTTPRAVQARLKAEGMGAYAEIETPDEYQPSFVQDLIDTFSILGDVIGAISVAVAAITIFIIIFVNAITQRKSIGILKGIGVSSVAIEVSYILQALFYVSMGALVGILLLYGVLVPYFQVNPIDFPFSDGILIAELSTTLSRTLLMFGTTAIAGYVPARYVVKQNTLDAILGR